MSVLASPARMEEAVITASTDTPVHAELDLQATTVKLVRAKIPRSSLWL